MIEAYELIPYLLLGLGIILLLFLLFKPKPEEDDFKDTAFTSMEYLSNELRKSINDIVNMDLHSLILNQKDLDNRKALKRLLSNATRECSQGNMGAKLVVTSRIKMTLTGTLNITEEVIDEVIPFQSPNRLTAIDKFEILMYLQKREGNHDMFRGICNAIKLDRLKVEEGEHYYSITEDDIEEAYHELSQPLSYDDKLNILTQRLYEETYGLSVVDMMIMEDDSIDGVSGGISGITMDNFRYAEEDIYLGNNLKPRTYESVWIFFAGKPIHMKFLTFQTNKEILRVCKNLSEYGRTGHFTSSEGGIKTHMANGSRVTVFRPNNGSQWAFFVRKFTSVVSYDFNELLTDPGSEYPIKVIEWGTKGCLNLFFSGDANSGKTTNTRAAVRFIDKRQPIRTLEADFELYLNDAYQDKNILGVRPSERMSFSKMIELLKASDAHTILFGETASLEHAKHLLDLLLAGTKRIITTGHWPTTDELISYFVHSLGAYGGSGIRDVEAMVSRLLHLDIHCVRDNDGHRYIDRITEIIPITIEEMKEESIEGVEGILKGIYSQLKSLNDRRTYCTRDLVIYDQGVYRMVNPFSDRLAKIIMSNLPDNEQEEFRIFQLQNGGGT